MTPTSIALAASVAIVAAGAATVAAPQQIRPGEMTQARVWIENRSRSEAIPTTIEGQSDSSKALRVELSGTPAVTITPSTIVRTHSARQAWDYRTVTIAPGADLQETLAPTGSDGWEAVGVQPAPQNGLLVVLKRPR